MMSSQRFVSSRRSPRRGAAVWPMLAIIGSLLLLGLLIWQLGRESAGTVSAKKSADPAQPQTVQPLVVLCAASNQRVMEVIRADYEAEFGIPIQVQYGTSQAVLASAEISKSGDLYLPADDSFLKIARERGLSEADYPLATMRAVVAIAQGNPKQIARLDDLLREDVRVCLANPEGAAIGKLVREVLSRSGQWDSLTERTAVFKTTVTEVATDVKLRAVDAGIVYDAVLHDFPDLEAVSIPELDSAVSHFGVTILKSSTQPQQAAHFARYLSASDKGLKRYAEYGFQPTDGDPWSDAPELVLYAGSMLRPAIEETITAFERREGVRVTRVYNGCGILVAQMKAGQVPDAYFACDTEFMGQVSDVFPESDVISQNELVIVVKKGNPFEIASLKDLTKPGLRVGIGHEKQCAMGWITQETFKEAGLQSQLMKNVVVQTPTGDMLVNQMRSGSLDAAVVYLSNAAGSAEFLDAVRIQGIPCSVANQPFGVAKTSKQKLLGDRLLQAIRAESSQEKFAAEGFRWVGEQTAAP